MIYSTIHYLCILAMYVFQIRSVPCYWINLPLTVKFVIIVEILN